MAEIEFNFPRGNIKGSNEPGTQKKLPASLKKKVRPRKRKREDSFSEYSEDDFTPNEEQFVAVAVESMSYKKLQIDMLLLGCIRSITPFTLDVELPGKTGGKLKINAISEHYTKFLLEEVSRDDVAEEKDVARLNSMFHIGQCLPVRVISKLETEQGTKVQLSTDPKMINSFWSHKIFKKDLVVWAAVASKLDHGYVIDAGVLHTRIFLPFENVHKDLVIGQPLWCVVQECNVSSTASTVKVSILEEHLNTATQKNLNLHSVVPGMQFDFTVTKAIKYGIQGTYMSNCLGYINESYLKKPFEKINKYKKNSVIKAWLLYKEPTTNFGYFTLRNPEVPIRREYQKGKIVKAQILSKGSNGLNIKLSTGEKGFVAFKRLLHKVSKNAALKESLSKKFPVGSQHQCRILDFIHLDRVYVCTFEDVILKEKHFTESDVKIGELVMVKIQEVVKEGLVVNVGMLKGFIQNLHLVDVQYSENIKRKFSKGQRLSARVLSNDTNNGIHLTLKPSLVNSEAVLDSCDTSILSKQYPGVVVHKFSGGVLVAFYAEVRGILFRKHLLEMFPDYNDDMFYVGQVISTTVIKVTDNNVILSLFPPRDSSIQIGDYVSATVTKKTKNGLLVRTENCDAFVPAAHLSSSLSFSALLLETYTIGAPLEGLLCVATRKIPTLSLREGAALEGSQIPKFESLRGTLVRCSCERAVNGGIIVSAPFQSGSKYFKVPTENLLDNGYNVEDLNFQPQQAIVVKILEWSDKNKKIIKVTAKQSEVFSGDYKYSMKLLEQFLRDYDCIKDDLKSKRDDLASFNLGQRIECTVTTVTDSGCGVRLKNNLKGFVSRKQCPKNVKIGQKVQGVILWVNFVQRFAEVSLDPSIIKRINPNQDLSVGECYSAVAYVLVDHPEYVVAVLKNKECNGQLIFLPSKLHENSFVSRMHVQELEQIKIIIHSKVNSKLIGIGKKFVRMLKKAQLLKQRSVLATKTHKKPKLDEHVQSKLLNGNSKKNLPFLHSEEASKDDESDNKEDITDEHEVSNEESQEQNEEDDEFVSEQYISDSDDISEEVNEVEANEQHVAYSTSKNSDDLNNENEEYSSESDDETENKQNDVKQSNGLAKNIKVNAIAALPGVTNFFAVEEPKVDSSSSSEEEEEDAIKDQPKQKKQKLAPAEKKELLRLEEEELRRKELENADPNMEPQTIDQFQKVLTGKPNHSELWIKYISFLLANAEVDKARSAAKEALERIALDLTQERYNIWIALLNLENSYGDKNSFEETFEEATRCNDALSIYMATIDILANAQKFPEMEEKILKARRKFGSSSFKMWIDIGRIYYRLNKLQEGRNLKDIGLLKLSTVKDRTALVIQFAIMEFQYGEKTQGEVLFETVLQHYPKRVDIWMTYVDQVVKVKNIEGARQILERAVAQSMPAKKLYVLFKKFKDFEKKHGNLETVAYVVKLAQDRVGSMALFV